MHVVPAIDVRHGLCVRLRQGRFEEQTDYAIDPVSLARRYVEGGFPRLHLVDLEGCREGRPTILPTVIAIAAIPGVHLQVGGGLRDLTSVERCLEAGAQRIVVGSLAFESPDLVEGWIARLGPERITVAADVVIIDGKPVPRIDGWRTTASRPLHDTLVRLVAAGLHHVLCTDIGRDGMAQGPNSDLYAELHRTFPAVGIQASGGVRDAKDLAALERAGVASAVVGKSLIEGTLRLEEIRAWAPPDG